MITKGQIQVCIRLNAEVGKVPWGSFVDLHWRISLAYTSNILLTWKLWNRWWHWPVAPRLRAWWQPYSDCGLQTSAGVREWAKFMCTPIR